MSRFFHRVQYMAHRGARVGSTIITLTAALGGLAGACSDNSAVTSSGNGGATGGGGGSSQAGGGQGGALGPVCGNGITEPGEACDDGDEIDNNFCANNCTNNDIGCSNGLLDLGEACFDGSVDVTPTPRPKTVDIVVFDCDNDGDNDVVTLASQKDNNFNYDYPYLAVMRNDGSGKLSSGPARLGLGLGLPVALVHGNFDNNPGQDVAYISRSALEIYANTGDCAWSTLPIVSLGLSDSKPSTTPPLGAGFNLVTMNLDGDGRDDIALLVGVGGKWLMHYLSSTNALSPPTPAGAGFVNGMAPADIDNDGYDDLVLGMAFADRVLVRKWDSASQTFGNDKIFPVPPNKTGFGLSAVAANEVDGNNSIDIVTANRTDSTITTLSNTLDGSLFINSLNDASVKGTQKVEGRNPTAITLGDVTHASTMEALTCNAGDDAHPPTVSLMFSSGGQFYLVKKGVLPHVIKDFPLEVDLIHHTLVPSAPHLIDMNQDGASDIVLLLGDSAIAVLPNRP